MLTDCMVNVDHCIALMNHIMNHLFINVGCPRMVPLRFPPQLNTMIGWHSLRIGPPSLLNYLNFLIYCLPR